MRKYAVIDIGSFKVKCLIASVLSDQLVQTFYFSNKLTDFGSQLGANDGNILAKGILYELSEAEDY